MAKKFIPSVYTANDLLEGDSVYLGHDGWTRDIANAMVALTEDDDAVIATIAGEGERTNRVVGVYAVPVSLERGTPWPITRREQIKASRSTTMPVGPAAALSDAA